MVDDNVRKIIREHVRKILREDAYGGMDIYDTNSPEGMSFGSGKDFFNVFVKPFTDVVTTAAGKGKELSQRTQTLAKVAFEAMATSLIPLLEDDYSEIFANEKQNLDKLKAQYKDVYNSTWTAFKDNDVVMAAFMMSPSSMITAKIAQQAPIQTIKVLNVLTGGRLDGFLSKVVKKLGLGDTKKPLDRDEGPGVAIEGRLHELHKKKMTAGAVLTQKKIKQTIEQDQKTSKMSSDAQNVVEEMLKQVLQRAQAVINAKGVEDLQKKLGIKIKGTEKLKEVPENERQALEQPLMKALKQSALSLYIKGLNEQLETLKKAGVSNDHQMFQMISNAISKIKSAA